MSDSRVTWLKAPQEHDFPAAASYLHLVTDDDTIADIDKQLRAAPTTWQKAKDLLRASALPLLDATNPHVASDLAKIAHGEALSPILLVRGDLARGLPLAIADGYHRVCASYLTDENTDIPCRLASLEGGKHR